MLGKVSLRPFVALVAVSVVKTIIQGIEIVLFPKTIIGGIGFYGDAFSCHFLLQVAQISYQSIGRLAYWSLCLKGYYRKKCYYKGRYLLHSLTSSVGKLVVCALLLLPSSFVSV